MTKFLEQRRRCKKFAGICLFGRITGNGWRADCGQRREGGWWLLFASIAFPRAIPAEPSFYSEVSPPSSVPPAPLCSTSPPATSGGPTASPPHLDCVNDWSQKHGGTLRKIHSECCVPLRNLRKQPPFCRFLHPDPMNAPREDPRLQQELRLHSLQFAPLETERGPIRLLPVPVRVDHHGAKVGGLYVTFTVNGEQ